MTSNLLLKLLRIKYLRMDYKHHIRSELHITEASPRTVLSHLQAECWLHKYTCSIFSIWQRDLATYHGNMKTRNRNPMGLLPDCGLRMRRECQECFCRHRFQRKPLVSDPGMHHDTASRTCRDAYRGRYAAVAGKTCPAFPAHAPPTIFHIW